MEIRTQVIGLVWQKCYPRKDLPDPPLSILDEHWNHVEDFTDISPSIHLRE